MNKRLILLVLSVMLVILSFPATAFATERYEILKIGDQDEYVNDLQNKLKELGFFDHKVTGYYGTVTQQAVMDYQSDNSLAVDGKAGPQTLRSIFGSDYTIPSDRLVENNNADGGLDTYGPSDKGDVVSDIQKRLQELEYYDYSTITGYYGPVTEAAVKRFQRTNGMTVDGIAGPETQLLLISDKAKYFCIYPGDSGSDVSALQTRLCDLEYYTYGKITGYFGTVTEKALKEFQAQNGLSVDAKAGKNTRAQLFSDASPKWDGVNRTGGEQQPAAPPAQTTVEKMLGFANEQLEKKICLFNRRPHHI